MSGLSVYKQQAAVTEDPYKLILKLYEAVLRNLAEVKTAIDNEDIEKKFEHIDKAIAIFDELRNVLNYDGGDVAYYLDGLYLYQIQTLFSAGVHNNINDIDQVMRVTQGLIEAWKDETGL